MKELRKQLSLSNKFYGAPYKLTFGLLSPVTLPKFQRYFKIFNYLSQVHIVLLWLATATTFLSSETQLKIQLMSLGIAILFTTAGACRQIYSVDRNIQGVPSFINAMIRMEKHYITPSNLLTLLLPRRNVKCDLLSFTRA
jgi:hypothetical protein